MTCKCHKHCAFHWYRDDYPQKINWQQQSQAKVLSLIATDHSFGSEDLQGGRTGGVECLCQSFSPRKSLGHRYRWDSLGRLPTDGCIGFICLNPQYALDFLFRAQNASKSIALLHLTHSPERCYGSFVKCLIFLHFELPLRILMHNMG